MGRAKLNMELITKEKSRNITFKKRKEGLIRKMHEFTTLCDVSACIIIYGPKSGSNSANEPEIWPQDIDEVRRVIEIYRSKSKESGNKTFGLSDFFHDRKRKIEEELAKLRKKNMESKYPTWLEFMNLFPEEKLREFSAALSVKSANVRSLIDAIKRDRDGSAMDMSLIDFTRMGAQSHHGAFYNPSVRGVGLEITNQQAIGSSMKPMEMHLPFQYNANIALDHHQELLHQNSMMMMMMMNDHNYSNQFGVVGPTGGNVSFKRQVYYESTSAGRGVMDMDPLNICHSPRPLASYYVPPQVGPYMGSISGERKLC